MAFAPYTYDANLLDLPAARSLIGGPDGRPRWSWSICTPGAEGPVPIT